MGRKKVPNPAGRPQGAIASAEILKEILNAEIISHEIEILKEINGERKVIKYKIQIDSNGSSLKYISTMLYVLRNIENLTSEQCNFGAVENFMDRVYGGKLPQLQADEKEDSMPKVFLNLIDAANIDLSKFSYKNQQKTNDSSAE